MTKFLLLHCFKTKHHGGKPYKYHYTMRNIFLCNLMSIVMLSCDISLFFSSSPSTEEIVKNQYDPVYSAHQTLILPHWSHTVAPLLKKTKVQSVSQWLNLFLKVESAQNDRLNRPIHIATPYPFQSYFCFYTINLIPHGSKAQFKIKYITAEKWQQQWQQVYQMGMTAFSTTVSILSSFLSLVSQHSSPQSLFQKDDHSLSLIKLNQSERSSTHFFYDLISEIKIYLRWIISVWKEQLSDQEPSFSLAHKWNRSPGIQWNRAPKKAKSLVLLIIDLDTQMQLHKEHIKLLTITPTTNQTLMNTPTTHTFIHWSLANIDPTQTYIPPMTGGKGIHITGKQGGQLPHAWSLANDYTYWFRSALLQGKYAGYDGPCIAGHDLYSHRMLVLLLALDHKVDSLNTINSVLDLLIRIQPHILAYTWEIWKAQAIYGTTGVHQQKLD
jgi:phosphatidylethanolamine-binding protein (PEBP) family uncharacterized protein